MQLFSKFTRLHATCLGAAAVCAVSLSSPANAATNFWNAGSWGTAGAPGYYDGVSGTGYSFTLAQDLPEQQQRTVGVSDLSDFVIGWWADLRISPITQEKRYQSWIARLGDIEDFSATLKTENGTIRIYSLFLKTKYVEPSGGDADRGPSTITITPNSFGFSDLRGGGGGGMTYGIPEPAAWAMMIAGFGIAGLALRRSGSLRRTSARLS